MKKILMILALVSLVGCGGMKDDTDPSDGVSGLGLYTDHLTGCQYLTRGRNLTPRMNAEGKQVCNSTMKGGSQ